MALIGLSILDILVTICTPTTFIMYIHCPQFICSSGQPFKQPFDHLIFSSRVFVHVCLKQMTNTGIYFWTPWYLKQVRKIKPK